MLIRQRMRSVLTALLLCIHANSIVFFIGLLCVSSDDLALNVSSTTEVPTDWSNFDIKHANSEKLRAYKIYLESELANVTRLLNVVEKKSKRYIPLPVSASLPDHISSDFVIGRFNESSSPLLAEKTNESEIRDDNKKESETEEDAATPETELAIVREVTSPKKLFGVQTTHLSDKDLPQSRHLFEPTQNHTTDECVRLTQAELVTELKQKGTYNPNLMAWDALGVFRFLDRSIVDQYERHIKTQKSNKAAVQRNVEALERILTELNLNCDVHAPEVLSRLSNLTLSEPRRTIMSPSIRMSEDDVRSKRQTLADDLVRSFNNSRLKDDPPPSQPIKNKKMIGDVHVVPFGCDKRGEEEDGYLRLCGACQAIRKLPETFFPPFINEVVCDEDRACLYFYEYPHGKCKQKHMNFVVLRNVGTPQCQIWQKFNLNVRVSCECFVDELSFFSKYV